jgi:4-oxalocrotonate tautomerase
MLGFYSEAVKSTKENPMPFIHVQVSGSADDALAARVASTASELTAKLLGKDPALTAVVVEFVQSRHWFVAGRVLSAAAARSYHWRVSITDETNTKREKAAYLAAVHAAMDSLLGGAADHSYTEIADVRAAAYGYGGLSQEHRYQHP